MSNRDKKRLSYRGNERLKSCPSIFCSECLCPSDGRKAKVCSVCGSRNGFIGFYERVKRDSAIPYKLKCTPHGDALSLILCAVVISIICAVKLSLYAQSGVYPDNGEALFATLILQIIPLIGAIYILLKGEALLGLLYFLLLPTIILTMMITEDVVFYLLSTVYIPGIISFFYCTHQIEMYEPQQEEKKPQAAANQWECPYCGYINGVESAECKSCGK